MNFPWFSAVKASRWFRRLIWATGLFVAYVLIGFFVLPPVLKWQMLKRLPDITKRQAAIRQVKFNPLTLSLTIRDLALSEPDGRPFASWDELYINFQSSSLFRWAWTFKEIRLVRPFGEVLLFKDGSLNFANMFVSPSNPPPPTAEHKGSVPRINIFHLQITNGFLVLEDQTRRSPFHTEYRPINLDLTQFSTRPNSDAPYSFRAESDAGRSVTWAGDLVFQPLHSQGHLEVTGVKLSRYQPYLEDFTTALVTNGTADLQLDYRFAVDTNGMDLVVTNGAIHVEQVQVEDPVTGETVAGLRGFDAQQAELNWRARSARLGIVKVSDASLLARRQKNGAINLLQLLTLPAADTNTLASVTNAPAPQAEAPIPWTVSVDDLAIQNTAVTFEDLALRSPFRTELKPLTVSLKHFTTKPECDADYSFHIDTEAAESLEGAGKVSINPPRSSGEVKLTAVDVKKYLPYGEDFFRGRITAGKLAVTVPYQLALLTNQFQAGVSNLTVQLSDLEIKAPGTDETVTHLAGFELAGVDASLAERQAHVGLVKLSGGSVLARREQDGSLNLLGLLAPGPTNDMSSGAAGAGSQTYAWRVNIDELALNDYTLKVQDRTLPKPGTLLLDQLALDLKGLSTDMTAPLQVSVSTRFNETGTLAAEGSARVQPQSAEITLGLTNLDLRPFQPWLDQYLSVGIVSGAFGTHGHVVYQPEAASGPHMTFAGELSLTNFVCTDELGFAELARWQQLSVNGIDCSLEPTRAKIAEVSWLAPKGTLLIRTNRTMNLAVVLKPAGACTTNAAPVTPHVESASGPNADTIPVEIGVVKLDKAAFGFVDESIEPHARIGIQEMSGTIKGLSSALNTTADVNLAGKVDEQSPFSVVGRINPLSTNLFVDLVISNANTQLTPLTPYMEKYAGHALDKGRLTTQLRYHVEGKELKADNKIDIEHLTLGPRNTSPDATSLPVKLAVALLKDRNGRIELNLPVHGRLDDPQFSLGPVIMKVLMNMLAKAVASPFKLLGALVGGGEEMSFVSFSPGTTNLVDGEVEKLTKLAKALAQRPALSLEIEGAIDPVTDREALAKQQLRQQLKARRLQELKDKAPQAIETFQLSSDDYERLLRADFAEKFGTNITAILQTNQLALASTNQPGARPGAKATGRKRPPLYRRVLALVGIGTPHRSKAEKHLPKAARLALQQATPEVMETLLARQLTVSDDDYRELMNARARWVQDWLVGSGQVSNERLLLVAPKPVAAGYQGASEARLSLD